MNKEPHVETYIDDEEKELIEAIELDEYAFGESTLSPERLEFVKQAAKNTVINIYINQVTSILFKNVIL